MSDVYLIEVRDLAVGLVARDQESGSYRFHAAVPEAYSIDGELYPTPDHARRAARMALGRPRSVTRPAGPLGELRAVA